LGLFRLPFGTSYIQLSGDSSWSLLGYPQAAIMGRDI
jgi:hypothetical protein